MNSVKTVGLIGLASAAIAVLAAVAGYWSFKPRFEREMIDELQIDIVERASRQRLLFSDVSQIHYAAERTMMRRYAELSDIDVSEVFNQIFPLQRDGTRRSAPELFDGSLMDNGDSVFGVGAFIAGGSTLGADEMRLLLAAYHTVRQHGEAAYGRFDNLYFHTPANHLIIFGPAREDRLEFYRSTAPADFDFQDERIAQVVTPQNNPSGLLACTELSRLIYRQDGQALTTGCHTPVREHGRHLGAFGVTIDMQNYLANAILDHREGSQNIVISREGEIIAHGDLLLEDELTPDVVSAAAAAVDADGIAHRIRDLGRAAGGFQDEAGRFVTYARLDAPGWYFVTISTVSEPASKAFMASLLVALFAFLAGLAQFMILTISTPKIMRTLGSLSERRENTIKILRI